MAGAVVASAAMLAIAAAERQELQADQKTRCCWCRQGFYSVHEATGGDVCRECRSVRRNTIDKQMTRHADHHQAQRRLGQICLVPGFGLKTLLCRQMKAAVAETPHAHHKIVRQHRRQAKPRRRKNATADQGCPTGSAGGAISAGLNF